tara:strand:- start:926 stop:1102 length:177 start_codon:yes stop_codon:yes gene_type:complete
MIIRKYELCSLCLGEGMVKLILPLSEKTNGHDETDISIECPKCRGIGELEYESNTEIN